MTLNLGRVFMSDREETLDRTLKSLRWEVESVITAYEDGKCLIKPMMDLLRVLHGSYVD